MHRSQCSGANQTTGDHARWASGRRFDPDSTLGSGCPRQVNEERFEIFVEAGLYRLVHTLLKFLRIEPACGEVITKLRDGTVSLGVADSEWSLLDGPGLRGRTAEATPTSRSPGEGRTSPECIES